MFRVEINIESKNQVLVDIDNFIEECFFNMELYDEYFDIITDYIYGFDTLDAYSVDNLSNSLYSITCSNEKIAKKLEILMSKKFDEIESAINDELEELEEELEEE